MNKIAAVLSLFVVFALASCGSKRQVPDVSKIKVSLQVQRFDRDFFTIDTNHTEAALDKLQQLYPEFMPDFLYNILALPPQKDSVLQKVKQFIHDYKPVYDSVQKVFPDIKNAEQSLHLALQLTHHYFPGYKIPARIICFTGPIEGYGNVLTSSGFAVGLQLYLGKQFSLYQTDYIREVYPDYQARRFEAPYIPVNCVRNLIEDMFPANTAGKTLMEQMIENGKRLYVMDQLLPYTADSLKTGYTQAQLDACYKNEATIWNFFLQNDLLYNADPVVIRDYVTDGPKTNAFGDQSPGNLSQFSGWQIVKKWMAKNEGKSLEELMRTPARQLFEETRYKPR
ncbi:gliding motility lipoprotein GldB [Deminuibacter soli]|uniref:Uncharacterized protein n=1 Tax=Deminuibacter soli TaxID=2291815 RepID=A0A3E1NDA9_9BACT|nr:hypothetical protein [Deminuibacter soli]RFM25956.1 hypothetical protein DXN05_22425 [Deminuibacter soli]